MMRIALVALAIFGSTCHAAKKSATEVVSFNNDNKEFTCTGRNVEWYFPNQTRITKSSERFQIESTNENESTLTVKKINAASIGTYKCLSIIDGVEEDFNLKLYYPLAINHFNRLQTVQENDNVTLKCKTISIPSVEKITWYHAERELVPDTDYETVRDGILLRNVKAEQAGEYSCIATQKIGTLKNIQQRDMELIVEYGPRQAVDESTIVYGKIGEKLFLSCEAECQPAPVFKWLKNGYETFENIHIRDFTSTLEVEISSADDFETYTCLASNTHGESSQKFVLQERKESEQAASKTSSKTAGVLLYTLTMLISAFIIYY